jgi:spore coat protein H
MKKYIYLLISFIIFFAISCGGGSSGKKSSNDLVEDRTIYANDDLTVLEVSLSIGDGSSGDLTYQAWQGVCDAATDLASEPPSTLFTFSNGTFSQEAEVKLRGASSRFAEQKSYKIEFTDKTNLWRQQNNINLIKHPYDFTRVRNKLSFDLFKNIPHFTSLRTQFVHLTINGVGYGLYEMIENCDKLFLDNHGLDPYGHLYKAKNLSFSTGNLSDLQTAIENSDLAAFETHLEIKGSKNHSKLLQMLEDVNNSSIDIDEVISTHFNRNNYLTWLAINILMFNRDTVNQNFFLYSPSNKNTWYFLPWDYDGAWGWEEQPDNLVTGKSVYLSRKDFGMANYWNVSLQKRFIQKTKNLADLNAKIAYLRTNYLTNTAIGTLMDSYHDIVYPYVNVGGEDNSNLPWPIGDYNTEYSRVRNSVLLNNYNNYISGLENPMPVWLDMQTDGNDLIFSWDESFDLQGDNITYTFQLATTPFDDYLNPSPENPPTNLVLEVPGLTTTSYTYTNAVTVLPADDYLWRVLINDSDGNWQIPFDSFWDDSSHFGTEKTHYGMYFFSK